jgi:hypothetical protein
LHVQKFSWKIWLNEISLDPGGHAISMAVFGFAGYWAYQWDQRAGVLLAEKKTEIQERRQKAIEKAAATQLVETE